MILESFHAVVDLVGFIGLSRGRPRGWVQQDFVDAPIYNALIGSSQMYNREKPILGAATNGAHSAVLYARVSTKEQEQGYSILAQQRLLEAYGRNLNLSIESFSDAETAKTVGRPGFNAMLAYLKKHPGCRVLLVEKTDRLYRNFRDYVTIDELDLEIHLVKENGILNKDSRSGDKLMHGLRVVMAKDYIDNLSEEVKKGLRTKAAQGLFPSYAPLGYSNVTGPNG